MTETTEMTNTPEKPAEEPEIKRLRAVLPKAVYQRLQHAAIDREMAPNDVLVEALERVLGEDPTKLGSSRG